ncbi:MAG: tRNA lysidine(34) synthetase TilS [Candidatus Omnitrophota bacterium]
MKRDRQNLTERVLKTVRNYGMIKPGSIVLAAVSGGPDSVFLLHTLNALKRKLKLKELIVCNLDHGLRGAESAEDSLFVGRLAKELGLKIIYKNIDLLKERSKELSPEEMAREARYNFFRDAAKETKADIIATGHTLDDQAETILMRIIKGSSLKGIVGISPVREERSLSFVRPLIELEKEEIIRYLDGDGIPYRIDSSNLSSKYFRNLVRKEVIPFLERYNPRLKRVLFNLAEHLREDFEFIAGEKAKSRSGISARPDGSVEICLKDIVVQPKALQKEVLRDLLEKAGGSVKKLSFRHWKEMEGLIRDRHKGNSVDLPGGVRIMRTDKALVLGRPSLCSGWGQCEIDSVRDLGT